MHAAMNIATRIAPHMAHTGAPESKLVSPLLSQKATADDWARASKIPLTWAQYKAVNARPPKNPTEMALMEFHARLRRALKEDLNAAYKAIADKVRVAGGDAAVRLFASELNDARDTTKARKVPEAFAELCALKAANSELRLAIAEAREAERLAISARDEARDQADKTILQNELAINAARQSWEKGTRKEDKHRKRLSELDVSNEAEQPPPPVGEGGHDEVFRTLAELCEYSCRALAKLEDQNKAQQATMKRQNEHLRAVRNGLRNHGREIPAAWVGLAEYGNKRKREDMDIPAYIREHCPPGVVDGVLAAHGRLATEHKELLASSERAATVTEADMRQRERHLGDEVRVRIMGPATVRHGHVHSFIEGGARRGATQ